MKNNTTTIDASKAVIYAEYRLLHALVISPDFLRSGEISEDLLIHNTAKSVFKAISNLVKASVPLTIPSIYQAASTLDIGITSEVIETIYSFPEDKVEVITDVISTLRTANNKLEIAKEIEDAMSDLTSAGTEIDIDSIKSKIRSGLDKLESMNNDESDVLTIEEWFKNYIPEYLQRKHGKQYPFNDIILDEIILKGAQPGDIGLIASSTGQGKSTYCLNLINQFINTDIPCMYFTLEMGEIDTMDRLLSIRTEIPFKSIVAPSEDEFNSILEYINKQKKELESCKRFRLCENPSLSINDLIARIKRFQEEIGQDYCIVVLDLLSQIQDFCKLGNGSHNMAQIMEIAINRLHAVAKELKIHIMGVVQFGRGADSVKVLDLNDIDKLRPNRNDIKNANALTERARYVLSLFRPKFYADMYLPELEETKNMEDIVELGSLKMSNGGVGRKHLLFQPEVFKMTPLKMSSDLADQALG